MAIFGNFKGTTQSDFKIGKSTGNKLSTGTEPSSDLSAGDLFLDSSNSTVKVYNGSSWQNIGSTLPELNVDSGTLFVDSSNDTVSVGSTSSNEKLFVNGNLRLGTNPSLQFAGAYLDVHHANGTATQLRVRDNSSGSDPIFKIYNANNSSEVFKIEGNEVLYSDNVKAKFGTGGDLEIYHDGNNSYIDDAGTGSLKIRSGTVTISNAAGSKTSVVFNSGGSQDLYHNNTKKFETTNSGIQTTGTVNVNGAYTLPTSDGSANQVLQTDGSGAVSFAAISVTPAGSNTQIQFNDSGSSGADASLTFDKAIDTLQTGIVKGILFEPITDYGSIATTANMTIDYGSVASAGTTPAIGDFEYINDVFGPVGDTFTVSTLPGASQPGQMIYVSDETGGSVMAFSDGSNWRRITDRAVVS
tara:strand:+ start:766 stop:2004 length:1239 start_codon:yes stop_codon:yes gene_type:complete